MIENINPSLALGFFVSGGHIQLSKKTFAKEMLKNGSLINTLCTNWKSCLKISKSETHVIFEIASATTFNIGEDYESIILDLKQRHSDNISGAITIRVDCGHSHHTTIDLN